MKTKKKSTAAPVLAAILGLAAASCTSDSGVPSFIAESPEGSSRVSIALSLSVGHAGEGFSRATRPLDSSDAAQRVSNVRVYLFRAPSTADPADNSAFRYSYIRSDDRLLPYYYIPSFEKTDTWTSGDRETHAVLLQPYLESGYRYRLLAVGRDDISEATGEEGMMSLSTLSGEKGWVSLTENPSQATTLAEAAMSLNLRDVRLQACELFTGATGAFTVAAGQEDFTATATLSRSVAGILVYIENIPTHFNALVDIKRPGILNPHDSVSLITRGKDYRVSSVAIAPLTLTPAVNICTRTACGDATPNTNFRAYFADFNLSGASESDGYFTATSPGNAAHPNSIRIGSFILPSEAPADLEIVDGYGKMDHTLYLVFYTTDNDISDHTFAAPFFWWPVESVSQRFDESSGEYADSPGSAPESRYALKANHIYSLGERYGNTDAPADLTPLVGGASRGGDKESPRLIIKPLNFNDYE